MKVVTIATALLFCTLTLGAFGIDRVDKPHPKFTLARQKNVEDLPVEKEAGTSRSQRLREIAYSRNVMRDNTTSGRKHPATSKKLFRAIWNLPNYCNDSFGIELPLAEYGIEFNSNHNWTSGNVVVLLNGLLGLYPRYKHPLSESSPPLNGGLPQLANITQHLEKATADIIANIPDPDFDGVGVIDWEAWRPQWEQDFSNLSLYRKKSVKHVKAVHPEWDQSTVDTVAELEWTQGAKLYMQSTLELAKRLRPKAFWGYYAFPYCYNHKETQNMSCTANAVKTNNEAMWLFNASTALYPSIYLRPIHPREGLFARGHLAEAMRLREKSSNPTGAVMAYTRFNYSHSDIYLSLEDLNNTILQSAEMGLDGVIFWGDNANDNSIASCTELRSYLNTALGPVLTMSQKGAESCSERICNGHGRCVGNILTCTKAPGDPRKHRRAFVEDGVGGNVCTCRCMAGWHGDDCNVPA